MLKEINIVQLLKTIYTSWKTILIYAGIGAVLGVTIAYTIPRTYVSYVKLAPESNSSSLGGSAMGGLSSMFGMGNTMSKEGITRELYPEIVKSSVFKIELAKIPVEYDNKKITLFDYLTQEYKTSLFDKIKGLPMTIFGWVTSIFAENSNQNVDNQNLSPEELQSLKIKTPDAQQQIYESILNKSISIFSDKKTGVITIMATMQNPRIAAQVADSVMSNLNRYIIKYRTSKSQADVENYNVMLTQAKQRYDSAYTSYAKLLDRNQNLVSETARIRIRQAQDERDIAFAIYSETATQLEAKKVKLQEETPIATIIEPARVPRSADAPSKLKFLLGFAALGAFVVIAKIIFKEINKTNV